jgi:hypothetical protein
LFPPDIYLLRYWFFLPGHVLAGNQIRKIIVLHTNLNLQNDNAMTMQSKYLVDVSTEAACPFAEAAYPFPKSAYPFPKSAYPFPKAAYPFPKAVYPSEAPSPVEVPSPVVGLPYPSSGTSGL